MRWVIVLLVVAVGAVYERARSAGRFLVREPRTWTVTLARERGRWRFVRGFDSV